MRRRLGKGHAIGRGELADLEAAYVALQASDGLRSANGEDRLGTTLILVNAVKSGMQRRLHDNATVGIDEVGDLVDAMSFAEKLNKYHTSSHDGRPLPRVALVPALAALAALAPSSHGIDGSLACTACTTRGLTCVVDLAGRKGKPCTTCKKRHRRCSLAADLPDLRGTGVGQQQPLATSAGLNAPTIGNVESLPTHVTAEDKSRPILPHLVASAHNSPAKAALLIFRFRLQCFTRRLKHGRQIAKHDVQDCQVEIEQLRSALAKETSAEAAAVDRAFEKSASTMQRRLASNIPIADGEVGDLEDAVDALQRLLE
jgi:hypothetical protein